MKKQILFFLILLSCSSKSDIKTVQYYFIPSFSNPTKFTIDFEEKTIEQCVFQNSYYVKEILDSNLIRRSRKDTLIVHYNKTFQIDNQNMNTFMIELKSIQLDSTVVHREQALDGLVFRMSSINLKNDSTFLMSTNLERNQNSLIEYQLLDAFFKLSLATIDDYEGVSVVENIQDYFSYGIPIRKINHNPIEFRIWGTLSGCREDNPILISFLKNLPNNEPVIFDIRNGSMSYCLNEVFEDFGRKKKIYIYGDTLLKVKEKIGFSIQNINSFVTKEEVLAQLALE